MAKARILLVDDEQDLLNMAKLNLENSGYEVITAGDGVLGLKLAQEEHPDLIILDLMLPEMDGYKVCAMLKYNNRYKHIPIILFTARSAESDRIMGMEQAKGDAYINKPFNLKTLLDKIEELLSKK